MERNVTAGFPGTKQGGEGRTWNSNRHWNGRTRQVTWILKEKVGSGAGGLGDNQEATLGDTYMTQLLIPHSASMVLAYNGFSINS